MATADVSPARVEPEPFTSTRNACKLCAPLGACLAFRGVEGAVPFLHGSQGCSTYIRRYMISHFKEPVDIACSNFGETTAIFGGKQNLQVGLENVMRQYRPQLIGIATTCLAETIGDDVSLFLHQIRREKEAAAAPGDGLFTPRATPPLVCVSTPSYAGSHAEGFHAAVRALVAALAEGSDSCDDPSTTDSRVNLMPGMVSPADIRHLRELLADFGLAATVVPDYSDTLDGPAWQEYRQIPPGGTPIDALRAMGSARATIELGSTWDSRQTAGALLADRHGVPRHELPLPIGVCLTDALCEALEQITGRPTPEKHEAERGRLIDAMVDAHKYVFGKRAVVYGEPDLVVGLAGLLAEIGVVPAICASGASTGRLREAVAAVAPDVIAEVNVLEDVDFSDIEEQAADAKIDLVVGNSKGFKLSKKLGVPLVRVGFPIHDRIGGPRLMHVGYRGAQQLFDRIANALLEAKQSGSPVGYTYM
jgi:nitrogenase molybdenum-iron protein NifN